MAKRKTLGQVAALEYCTAANEWATESQSWERAAAAVEAEVLRRLEESPKMLRLIAAEKAARKAKRT